MDTERIDEPSAPSAELLHPADLSPDVLQRQCETRRVRRSGPGGQHRNKVETGVVLLHRPTGVQAEANERRSQSENLAVATGRLRRTLAVDVRRLRSPPAVPSALWRRRCVQGKLRINPEHADFPSLLAEALDILAECDMDPARAGARLGCSPSQLIKLLKREPRAFEQINAHRTATGQHRLK